MPRIIPWPLGLKFTSRTPLTGPRVSGGSGRETLTGFTQTVASPFGAWRWQFTFPPMRGVMARRYRGMVTALHGGANAVRVPFRDPDGLTFAEAGTTITVQQEQAGLSWSNTLPWSNGMNWQVSKPLVAVAAAAAKGASVVTLANQFWRNNLGYGDQIGFMPYHFGLYVITEVIGGGQFRIWPPLRAPLITSSYATLEPTLVMRLESESAAPIARGVQVMEAPTITLTEITDDVVRLNYEG